MLQTVQYVFRLTKVVKRFWQANWKLNQFSLTFLLLLENKSNCHIVSYVYFIWYSHIDANSICFRSTIEIYSFVVKQNNKFSISLFLLYKKCHCHCFIVFDSLFNSNKMPAASVRASGLSSFPNRLLLHWLYIFWEEKQKILYPILFQCMCINGIKQINKLK